MFFIYEFLALLILIFSPLIFILRIILGKEDPKRFLEKLCIYSNNYNYNKTIWFHGASVGEILSIIPIIKILEKNKKINKILLTSSTTSSAFIFKKYKFKKTLHVYYPIDENILTKKFINYWKPQVAIFIDSEIWPNMIKNLSISKTPIVLINARITNKSYNMWIKFPNFAKKIFSKITIALPQNRETSKYLKELGVKKIKIVGNLKYFGELKTKTNKKIKKFFKNRNIICAASTHEKEEVVIGKVHKLVKQKYRNLITIIIPRHINRTNSIINNLEKIGLKVALRSSRNPIDINTDIYLVDTYGEALKFYGLSKISFVGGSLIPHGGQNPLEPARSKNYILYGPNIQNFTEVYDMLSKLKVAKKINNINVMKKIFINKINYNQPKKIYYKLNLIGKNILKKNIEEISNFIK